MGNPVIQVQTRLGSTRLPWKVLFHFRDRRVVGSVITRYREVSSSTVLTIGSRPENTVLVKSSERTGSSRSPVPTTTCWCDISGLLKRSTGPGRQSEQQLPVRAPRRDRSTAYRVSGGGPPVGHERHRLHAHRSASMWSVNGCWQRSLRRGFIQSCGCGRTKTMEHEIRTPISVAFIQ